MQIMLKIEIVFFAIIMMLIVLNFTKKDRISIKFSIVWLSAILFIVLPIILPNVFEKIKELLSFEMFSNLLFAFLIGGLIFISMSLTIIVSGQNKKINILIQEISILKEEKNIIDKRRIK
ncbi:MAG TPA: DUF2304 domain-containing protein [Clostridia bacterium]|nr:DUF2304 domain-containing protein [Clostridia bacterium]